MRHLPPLNYLRAFEASARHLSFTDAARELHCTQASISQQIRGLEHFIGRPLFVRGARSIRLSEVGSAYLPTVREALDQLAAGTEGLISRPGSHHFALSCPVAFATIWLAPRIASFSQSYPEIDIRLHCTIWNDPAPEITDLSIRLGEPPWSGLRARRLTRERAITACAPGLPDKLHKRLRRPQDLAHHRLIHVLGRHNYWTRWANALGLEDLETTAGLMTDTSLMALELAASGYGIALSLETFIQPRIDSGDLCRPFEQVLEIEDGHFLLEPTGRHLPPAAAMFRDWLLEQVGEP